MDRDRTYTKIHTYLQDLSVTGDSNLNDVNVAGDLGVAGDLAVDGTTTFGKCLSYVLSYFGLLFSFGYQLKY